MGKEIVNTWLLDSFINDV